MKYICLTDGLQVGAMHFDVVVVAPIQARHPLSQSRGSKSMNKLQR